MRFRLLILALPLAAAGCSASSTTGGLPAITSSGGVCHARAGGQLPDPACTPGAINPDVTQANIRETVCKAGWTATIRPPVSYTNRLKARQIRQYGFSDLNLHHYEEDHLVSLSLGGAPADPRNLWPEFDNGHVPNSKDLVEFRLRREVCAGTISLATAQHAIAHDWRTAP